MPAMCDSVGVLDEYSHLARTVTSFNPPSAAPNSLSDIFCLAHCCHEQVKKMSGSCNMRKGSDPSFIWELSLSKKTDHDSVLSSASCLGKVGHHTSVFLWASSAFIQHDTIVTLMWGKHRHTDTDTDTNTHTHPIAHSFWFLSVKCVVILPPRSHYMQHPCWSHSIQGNVLHHGISITQNNRAALWSSDT